MDDKNGKIELSKGLFGATDRNNGEYHFKSGYTKRLYSDAHFSSVDDSTVPPVFYKPSESNGGNGTGKKKKRLGLIQVLLLCILCAVIGGISGAAIMTHNFSSRMSDVEESVRTIANDSDIGNDKRIVSEKGEASEDASTELTAAQLYKLACKQVASVTTEYTNIESGREMPGIVTGTAFVVSEDGYLVTNAHVVEKAYNGGYPVNVTFQNGTEYNGNVICCDEELDLALLHIPEENLTKVEFGGEDDIYGGQEISISGNPYGMFTVSTGHISNPAVFIDATDGGNPINMFQLDVSIYEGNSGGPVYNNNGEVIGIVSAKVNVDSSDGIGFAIPISYASKLFDELIEGGLEAPATLNAEFFEDYEGLFQAYYSYPKGAFIEQVYAYGCADNAGLCVGDVIMQIGDYQINSYADVQRVLKHFKAGDEVNIVYFREASIYNTQLIFDAAEK